MTIFYPKAVQDSRSSKDQAHHDPVAKPNRVHLRKVLGVLAFLVVLAVLIRLCLPSAVREFVNRTLTRSPGYVGKIGEVNLHLWRGAYSIRNIKISKTRGSVPLPFFSAEEVDFAMEWKALLRGKLVGRVRMLRPEVNFVDAPTEGEKQSGEGGSWLPIVRELFPFVINRVVIVDGMVHFRSFQPEKPVDVYLERLGVEISDLSNIREQTKPMVTTVEASGWLMGQAKMEFKMALDPFSYRPTFHLALRVLGLDVTKLNDLALAYGDVDFQRGWFDLVLEAEAREGQLKGYVKPLFRDLKVFSPSEDFQTGNILQFLWQALVGGTTRVLTNPPRNQFGTLIPFSGDLSHSTTQDLLATVANLLRNAFIRAYLPRLENEAGDVEGLRFDPPEVAQPITDTNP